MQTGLLQSSGFSFANRVMAFQVKKLYLTMPLRTSCGNFSSVPLSGVDKAPTVNSIGTVALALNMLNRCSLKPYPESHC